MLKKYLWNILIALDQFGNAIFGGDPQETISSRAGKMVAHWRQTPQNKARFYIARWLCWLLGLLDKGHCEKSINLAEGEDDVWRSKNGKF